MWPWLAAGGLALFGSYAAGSHFPVALALLVVAGLCLYAPYGPYFALVSTLAPAGVSGAAVAMVNSLGALGSFAGTYLVGWVRGTSLGDAGAFAFMAAGALVSAVLMLAVHEPRPSGTRPGTVNRQPTAATTRVLELSRGFQRSPAGYSAAAAPMRRLADRTGLPAIAGILHDTDVLLVLTAQGTQHLQLRSAEGTRNAWHATSLGKVLVAGLPERERDELLAAGLSAVTARTVTDPAAVREELDAVRERGWAEVDEENEVGVRSIAVAVPPPHGQAPRLAVSLGAAVALTGADELRAHVPALRACAEDIAAHMDH